MLNKNNKDDLELSNEAKERLSKLQTIIDSFEEVSLKYGPASSEELKHRINKIIRDFDKEFKKILELKFEAFWNRQNSDIISSINHDKTSDSVIPRFLKNYKK